MIRRAAAISWKIRPIASEREFFDHLAELLSATDADWIVLPEFFSFELLHLAENADPMEFLEAQFDTILSELERLRGSRLIVGGTHIARRAKRENIAPILREAGTEFQAKLKMTQFELTDMGVAAGPGLIAPQDGLSTLVCYDSEFPEAARVLCEAGSLALAVPAFTETRRGFQRVRWSCQARAIEDQIFVLHASLVGHLGFEPVPETHGSSAILCPSVSPFDESAILAETRLNEEGIAEAVLDFDVLMRCRESDDVRNWNDRSADCWRFV